MRDVIQRIRGHQRRQLEAWRRERFSAYIVYCANTEESKRESIYKFLELEDDPTPEEIAELEREEAERKQQEDIKAYYETIEHYRKYGVPI